MRQTKEKMRGEQNKGLSRPFFVAPHQRAQNSIQDVYVWSTTDKFDELMEQVGSATSHPRDRILLLVGEPHPTCLEQQPQRPKGATSPTELTINVVGEVDN